MTTPPPTKNIIMLCMGNHCRSPLAHAILQKLIAEHNLSASITVDSAGLGDWHVGNLANAQTRENAMTHGITMTQRSRRLTAHDVKYAYLIFSMDKEIHHQLLAEIAEKYHPKCHLFRAFDTEQANSDVPDPYYVGGFETVYQLINRNCKIILQKLNAGQL